MKLHLTMQREPGDENRSLSITAKEGEVILAEQGASVAVEASGKFSINVRAIGPAKPKEPK